MKMKPAVLALIVLIILFGGIQVSSAMGFWKTTSSKTPAKYESGEFAGAYNPADIRGSYTFAEIADVFQIKSDILLQAFGYSLDADPDQVKSKDLEARFSGADYEIGNGSMKVFVALYLDLSIELADEGLPSPAVDLILTANPSLSADTKAWLENHRIDISGFADVFGETSTAQAGETSAGETGETGAGETSATEASEASAGETVETTETTAATETHETKSDSLVKGTTTFQQVLDAGVTREQIEEILGVAMPAATNQAIKDFCVSQSIPFSSVKEQLSNLMS